MPEKTIVTRGIQLRIEKQYTEKGIKLSLIMEKHEHKKCLMHWGVSHHIQKAWEIPPTSLWPKGSRAFSKDAVQTPFENHNGFSQITLILEQGPDIELISFALFFPEEDSWDNNQGRNYQIEVSKHKQDPVSLLKKAIKQEMIIYEHVHHIEDHYLLAVAVAKNDTQYHVTLVTDLPDPLILHWGLVKRFCVKWSLPPPSFRPAGTTVFQNTAVETPFHSHKGLRRLQININDQEAAIGIAFVLRHVDTGLWLKEEAGNFHIPLISPPEYSAAVPPNVADLADEIIEKEMGSNSWTLMHRFNLCHDLLNKVENDVDALALIFVWMRFSAIRQLDWQRNYNTQPRELSHAQHRLTARLAGRYVNKPKERQLIRLLLTTMGRGGEGQRVRDEILNIMHRHHIKEISGRFMEEWHQKLHNNTTPDDVVICEAYLAFLRGNGDIDLFYRHLQEGGVTRQRLKSYERPIKAHPDFIGHLKEKLIHDFENFLGILRGVHMGTDLGAAIHAARPLLDPEMHELLDFVWWHRNDGLTTICPLVGKITKARKKLKKELESHGTGVRDLLFLDLALEDFLRVVVERNLHLELSKDQLVDLIAMMLENRSFTDDDQELIQCRRHWNILKNKPRFRKKWSLQAHAVLERLERLIGGLVDRYYQVLQQKAELLGKAFNSDSWTINIFSEEVVRGRPAFVLVMLLRHLNPILRRKANLGNWQVVSQGKGAGLVEVTSELKSVQGKNYDQSTVIVTDKIAGDEEIPQGITAIITPDTTDIVSHVAIRARNAHVLIATCYDIKTVDHLKLLKGQKVKLNIDKTGDVVIEKGIQEKASTLPGVTPVRIPIYSSEFTAYAVGEKGFNKKNVGGKSRNLKSIRSKLPEWIKVPGSAAIPFGVFHRVFEQENNNSIAKSYHEMTVKIESIKDDARKDVLKEIRKTVLALEPPDELESSFYHAIEKEGISPPVNWDSAWMGIKSVWSSKWNERAFLSRVTQGIPHENLVMAVLIQEIVEAEYSFVIHTQSPFTGDSDEIYAEVVLGLGETLVGNYPGRALGFSLKKGKKGANLIAFPSKSTGLFGTGLILRSDSNGEDLAGYAGAGLYDSVMLTVPDKINLDYSKEPLVWDEGFQKQFLATIGSIGKTVEDIMGSAQDIEGAYANGDYYVVQTRPQMGG